MTPNRAALAAPWPPLLAAAEQVAATVALGIHGRHQVGRGETFWQFRRYQSGDPASAIDWRQSARSVPLYVRETEWEAAQTIWLWNDLSGSMVYASDPGRPVKRDRALVISLALALLLTRAGERVAILGHPGTFGPGTDPERILQILTHRPDPSAGMPTQTRLPPHARVLLLSDFLTPLEDLETALRQLSAHRVRGLLLRLSDPAEETLPFEGHVVFNGLEAEPGLRVGRVQSVRDEYRAAWHDHRAALLDLARRYGWVMLDHRTDHPPQTALMVLYEALARGPGA